jgi:tRNA wybutosine-synthesizing protein 2
MRQIPFACITKSLSESLSELLPENVVRYLPEKWEKIGSVVIIKLPERLKPYKEIIGKAYAKVLRCTSTLNDVGGIQGVFREPVVEVIYGSPLTETIHIENKIRYRLDPQKIMFSSGNMAERKRMATISNPRETVIDLFAGIGYFSIPMAVYSKPKKIYACEINPVAFRYLKANVVLNQVTDIVEPLFGDNRMIAPKDCANRVVLGYLKESKIFLPVVLAAFKNQTGILHYHDVVPVDCIPQHSLNDIESVTKKYHRSIELLQVNHIKSYAPGRDHVVLDVRVVE